jgi:predicted alpha/beta superfamily hydrolase
MRRRILTATFVTRTLSLVAIVSVLAAAPARPDATQAPRPAASASTPLTFGESFTIQSAVLAETRRINVYVPPLYGEAPDARRLVIYMPDGGMAEDFLHVAGLVQVSVGNGTMRPVVLVGIENTERRRDLSGPTENAEDRKIAPRVGGSATFRAFIRKELMPVITSRYRTTPETAIVGESLAGLFVVETLLLEPDLFTTYIAFDPSLWWNDGALVKGAASRLKAGGASTRTLYFACSSEDRGDLCPQLAATLRSSASASLIWHYEPMPGEKHSTIFHPAAILAFRRVLKPL